MKKKKQILTSPLSTIDITFSKGYPNDTMFAYTGGGSLIHRFTIKLFGWKIVFWKVPKK